MMVNLDSTPLFVLLMTVPRMGSGATSLISCAYVTSTASPTLKSASGGRKAAIFTAMRATASRRTYAITSDARLKWSLPERTKGGVARAAPAAATEDDARRGASARRRGARHVNIVRGVRRDGHYGNGDRF